MNIVHMGYNAGIEKYTTTGRILNGSKLLYSYYKSRLMKKALISGYPVAASIEPTTACNLRCPQCPSGLRSFTRPTGNIDINLYKDTIDQLKDHLWFLTLYFQGEPMIHPNFDEMVGYAHDARIYTSTSTNAHFLNPESSYQLVRSGLDQLIVSVDGLDQKTYEKYRIKGNLAKVEEGLSNLASAKENAGNKKPAVILQFIVMGHNENQVPEVQKWAKSLGVDQVKFKSAQIYDHEKGSDLLPKNETNSRYEETKEGRYKLKNKLYDHCWRMWHSCVITWDGRVVPCCFDKDAKYVMGNLQDNSFKEIWTNELYTGFRNRLLSNRKSIDICQDCTEGTKVWL